MNDAYYDNHAFDSSRPRQLPPSNIEKLGAAWRRVLRNPLRVPKGTQCDEHLARSREIYILEQIISGKEEVEAQLKEPVQEEYVWTTLHNPKVALYSFTQLMLIFSVIFSIGIFFIIFIAIFKRTDFFYNAEFYITIIVMQGIPTFLFLLGKLLLKSDKIKDKNNVLFHRRKGTVTIPRKKSAPLEVPFDEFDPYMGSSVNPSGSVDYHLILAHRYTGSFVQHPGSTKEELNVYLEWEYMQQYMDISKPLPDVPSMEPFREKDPVTAAWDRRHNRPSRYWRDMDIDRARKMKQASVKAASEFPWGFTRQQALSNGWQPSGFGQGDWNTNEGATSAGLSRSDDQP